MEAEHTDDNDGATGIAKLELKYQAYTLELQSVLPTCITVAEILATRKATHRVRGPSHCQPLRLVLEILPK